MISITRATASAGYLESLVNDKYLTDGGESPGVWLRTRANPFGLRGRVERHELEALLRGYHPKTGEKLVQNAGKFGPGKYSRNCGLHMTFNMSKSESVAYAFASSEDRKKMERAFFRAVERTFTEFIPTFTHCRLGDGQKQKAVLTQTAGYFHLTSRHGDPQPHWHTITSSECLGPDGKIRAFVSKDFYRAKMELGVYFRLAKEQEFTREMGMEFYRPQNSKGEKKTWTEVKGVDRHLCKLFSTRRSQIDAQLAEKSYSSAAASAVATILTPQKGKSPPAKPALCSLEGKGRIARLFYRCPSGL